MSARMLLGARAASPAVHRRHTVPDNKYLSHLLELHVPLVAGEDARGPS